MGINVVEDENHLINDCDLYASLRNKLITRLNNAPHIQFQTPINRHLLKHQFHNLLSPYSSTNNENHNNDNNIFRSHHNNDDGNDISDLRRKYIINCVCTFLCHAIETRRKYKADITDREKKANTLVIHFENNLTMA